ncbi:hypothetical protein [Paenibacillus terrae]|uniref:Uncharacterized protein n=1 Tax=Paenibacillus terrae TaxID=159743 RepID=A0A0D7WYC9_9BACL|nr:hypothetical protein [Paenibacillus terrae]KJD43974.1 hypothetical protein QD47_19370 [Paenibacillus terrae]
MDFARFFGHTIKLVVLYLFITLIIPTVLNGVISQQLEKDGSVPIVNGQHSAQKVSAESEQSNVSNQKIFKAMQSLLDSMLYFLKPLLIFGILASFTLSSIRFMLWFSHYRLADRESRSIGGRVLVLGRSPSINSQNHDRSEQRQPSVADAVENLIQSQSTRDPSTNETYTEQPEINLNKTEMMNEENFVRTIRDFEPVTIPENDTERESSAFKRVIRS